MSELGIYTCDMEKWPGSGRAVAGQCPATVWVLPKHKRANQHIKSMSLANTAATR
jgi:hypothetical protein